METISYQTYGTCCKVINVIIDNDKIKDIEFIGGCQGNLRGIRSLVIGMNINDVIAKLKGTYEAYFTPRYLTGKAKYTLIIISLRYLVVIT